MTLQKTFSAYQRVGRLAKFYDAMMTNSGLLGSFAQKFFWGLSEQNYREYLSQAFAGVQENFSGRLLEVPVGTGVLSLPIYKKLPDAEIFCVDYSDAMLSAAKERAAQMDLHNVNFLRGDVGELPFQDGFFDMVLSVNGFHAFPDKVAAYDETRRVLKVGGIFCGCMYVAGQNWRTDFFVKNFCERQGFFTPPYETLQTLSEKLNSFYKQVKISNVKSFASFVCSK